jgi:hypothetical protein
LSQDFRFSSFPRMRESSHSLKRMDTRLRGYDEFTGLAKVLFLISLGTQVSTIRYPFSKIQARELLQITDGQQRVFEKNDQKKHRG